MTADREAFEKWAIGAGLSVLAVTTGEYFSGATQTAWHVWQAAQAAMPVAPAAREAIATAYAYLWCVNNEPGTPRQYPPERAAHEARKLLRDMLTKAERGEAINRVLQSVFVATPGAKP